VLRLFDSKNPLPRASPKSGVEQFLLLFLHLNKTRLAGMVVAEVLTPVYVWPAVRYTGEDLAFPTGAGSKLSEDLRDRRL
jgi:hypothetical protein